MGFAMFFPPVRSPRSIIKSVECGVNHRNAFALRVSIDDDHIVVA
jgi:hypothetical protein